MKAITIRLTEKQAARIEEIASLCQLAPESLTAVLVLSSIGASDHEPDGFIGLLFEEATRFVTKGEVPGENICRWLSRELGRRRNIKAVVTAVHRKWDDQDAAREAREARSAPDNVVAFTAT